MQDTLFNSLRRNFLRHLECISKVSMQFRAPRPMWPQVSKLRRNLADAFLRFCSNKLICLNMHHVCSIDNWLCLMIMLYTYTSIHMYIHIHTHTYIHTYTHIHTIVHTYVTGFGKTRQLRTKLIIQKNVIE